MFRSIPAVPVDTQTQANTLHATPPEAGTRGGGWFSRLAQALQGLRNSGEPHLLSYRSLSEVERGETVLEPMPQTPAAVPRGTDAPPAAPPADPRVPASPSFSRASSSLTTISEMSEPPCDTPNITSFTPEETRRGIHEVHGSFRFLDSYDEGDTPPNDGNARLARE